MALDTQTHTADFVTSTFQTIYHPPEIDRTSEPFGMLYHRENLGDDPTLDGSGVGDTPRLDLILPLQAGFVYRLNRFMMNVVSGDNQWGTQGFMTVFLSPPGLNTPGLATQLNYPLNRALFAGSVPGTETRVSISLGGGAGGGTSAAERQNTNQGTPPTAELPLILAANTTLGTQPVVTIATPNTNVSAGTFSYWAEWLMYRVEQTQNSGLYWPVPTAD